MHFKNNKILTPNLEKWYNSKILSISKINLFFKYILQISNDTQVAEDPCKDSRYKEPLIDAMRKQKDEVINQDI